MTDVVLLLQVLFVGGIISGAYVSAVMSSTYGSAKGVPVNYAFVGGLLIMLGSRIGGGCTRYVTNTCNIINTVFTLKLMWKAEWNGKQIPAACPVYK